MNVHPNPALLDSAEEALDQVLAALETQPLASHGALDPLLPEMERLVGEAEGTTDAATLLALAAELRALLGALPAPTVERTIRGRDPRTRRWDPVAERQQIHARLIKVRGALTRLARRADGGEPS